MIRARKMPNPPRRTKARGKDPLGGWYRPPPGWPEKNSAMFGAF
jgi:hypothetical protein